MSSIEFDYDAAARLRVARFTGDITDAIMVDAYRSVVSAPDYDPEANDLVDLRAVTRFGITANGMRDVMVMFAPIDQLGIPTRLAIVAPADAVYGVSRMYQMLRGDDVPETIEVFRSLDEAMVWLQAV